MADAETWSGMKTVRRALHFLAPPLPFLGLPLPVLAPPLQRPRHCKARRILARKACRTAKTAPHTLAVVVLPLRRSGSCGGTSSRLSRRTRTRPTSPSSARQRSSIRSRVRERILVLPLRFCCRFCQRLMPFLALLLPLLLPLLPETDALCFAGLQCRRSCRPCYPSSPSRSSTRPSRARGTRTGTSRRPDTSRSAHWCAAAPLRRARARGLLGVLQRTLGLSSIGWLRLQRHFTATHRGRR